MPSSSRTIQMYRPLFIFLCFTAGVLNGLFGMGGGILICFLLTHIYAGSETVLTKDIFAMTVLSVFLLSLSSVFLYAGKGCFTFSALLPYLLPAALGGLVGAFLLDKINPTVLKIIFSLLMIWGGVSLFTKA